MSTESIDRIYKMVDALQHDNVVKGDPVGKILEALHELRSVTPPPASDEPVAWPCDGEGDERGNFVCKKDAALTALAGERDELRKALEKIAHGPTSGPAGIDEPANITIMKELAACRDVARSELQKLYSPSTGGDQ